MRIIRRLVLVLVLFFSAALLLRHTGVEWIGAVLLAGIGLEQVQLDLTRIDHKEIALRSVAFNLRLASGPVAVRLDDARCQYRFSDLLRGKMTTCSARAVDIALSAMPRSQEIAPNTDLPRLDRLVALLKTLRIPLEQLHLPLLTLHGPSTGSSEPLRLELEYLAVAEGDHLVVNSAAAQVSPPLRLELRRSGTGLSADLNLDCARLLPLIPPSFAGGLPRQGLLIAQLESTATRPLHLRATLSDLRSPSLSLEKASLNLVGEVSPEQHALAFTSASQITLSNLQHQKTGLRAFSLNLGGTLQMERDRWRWRIQPAQPVTAEGLVVGGRPYAPAQLDGLLVQLQLDREQVQLETISGTPLGNGRLVGRCSHRWASGGQGECLVETQGPLVLDKKRNPLALLSKPLDAAIHAGTLRFSLQSQWQGQGPLSIQAEVDAAIDAGTFFEFAFAGLRLRQHLQVTPQLQSVGSGTLHLATLEGPVPMEDLQLVTRIRSDGRKRQPMLIFDKASVRVLDGLFRLNRCSYALNQAPSTCQLEIDHLNLEPLIALHKVEGLTVNGRMRGKLPLHLDAQGLRIDKGQLENEAGGGIIRYLPPARAIEESPLTAYALEAMRDLHYQQLTSEIDYQPDGTLVVSVHIRGNNPSLDNGRPVHLNLTTQQNILSLIRSLQYSQSLSSELGRKALRAP
jgi:hypothetical protein